MRMFAWLNKLFRRETRAELPDSLVDLRGSDPCWCGSGRKYARCHRPEDRRRMRELGISPAAYRGNPFV
jgi:hypothetical protein